MRVQPLRLHPQGYTDAVSTLLESDRGPDLVVFMDGMMAGLAPEQHFLDLGDFLASHTRLAADLYRLPQGLFVRNGRQYGLPFVFSPIVLAYDRTAFRDCGVPYPDASWTWHDLLAAAQQLTVRVDGHTRVERYGFHYQFWPTRWPSMVFANGGTLINGTGHPDGGLEAPESIEALQFMVDLAHRHGVAGSFSGDMEGETLFVLRRAAMLLASYYGADKHQFSTSGLDWDMALIPAGPAARPATRRHVFHATGIAINQRSPRLRAALEFVEFVVSRAAQEMIRQTGCSLPVRRSIVENPAFRDATIHPAHLDVFQNALEDNNDIPVAYTTSYGQAAHHELLLAFAGLEDIATACRRAAGLSTTAVPAGTW